MPKLLLIEDDEGISTPLSLYLENVGYEVILCENGWDALDVFRSEKPHVIILDINLPKKSGITVCQEIREISSVPLIVLSARESEEDKVKLLELWADDYVAKPFSPRELVARLAAVMKRTQIKKEIKTNGKILELGSIKIDTKNFVVWRSDEEVILTKTEFALLEYFLKNAKWVIKRETLMKEIMGYENYVYDRTIDTHVKNLRKKLDNALNIETVRGIGYRVSEI